MSERYVTFDDSGIHVDIGRYLRSPEGQAFLDRASTHASSPTAEDYEKAIAERQKRCAPAGTFAVIEQIRERAKEIARQRGEVSGE